MIKHFYSRKLKGILIIQDQDPGFLRESDPGHAPMLTYFPSFLSCEELPFPFSLYIAGAYTAFYSGGEVIFVRSRDIDFVTLLTFLICQTVQRRAGHPPPLPGVLGGHIQIHNIDKENIISSIIKFFLALCLNIILVNLRVVLKWKIFYISFSLRF